MPSQIIIEAEGLGETKTILRLRIDSHLISENLTTEQMKVILCEILDRIDVFETGKAPKGIERWGLH
jgi:hypothetical protein